MLFIFKHTQLVIFTYAFNKSFNVLIIRVIHHSYFARISYLFVTSLNFIICKEPVEKHGIPRNSRHMIS